jgi:hypothetical protein
MEGGGGMRGGEGGETSIINIITIFAFLNVIILSQIYFLVLNW